MPIKIACMRQQQMGERFWASSPRFCRRLLLGGSSTTSTLKSNKIKIARAKLFPRPSVPISEPLKTPYWTHK
jgi:hypothetical protein